MPWQNQGGGPWGSGGGSGGGGSPWGGGRPGGGTGGQPPNLEEMIRKAQERFRGSMPGGVGSGIGIAVILVIAFVLWAATGFYRVQPDEQGVVLRFGEWVKTTQPGLNYHLPYPIETADTPKVTVVNRVELGVQTTSSGARAETGRQVPEEALMLTGDENIVDINFAIFWRIRDAGAFLFNVRTPSVTIKVAGESTMREIIGQTPIASALAEGRGQIEAAVKERLQSLLEQYGAGVEITQVQLLKVDPPSQVIDAFRDVQRARADQERLRNEAEAYRNDIIPRARGEAERIVQEAEAYKQEVVARSQGDARRFDDVYQAYKVAKDVTTQRIYLETLEEVMGKANKILIDRNAGGPGVVPYLPLPEIRKRSTTSEPAASGETTQ